MLGNGELSRYTYGTFSLIVIVFLIIDEMANQVENYSQSEKVNALLTYGECRQNSYEAARLYADRFPERRHPTRHYFPKLVTRMRNQPDENQNEKFIVSENRKIDVLAMVEVNCTVSLKK